MILTANVPIESTSQFTIMFSVDFLQFQEGS